MKPIATAACIAVTSVACGVCCVPLRQGTVYGTEGYDSVSFDDYYDCVLVQLGPSNVEKPFTIVDSGSYFITPRGKRLGAQSEPWAYDLRPNRDARVRYVRDGVYPLDERGRRLKVTWDGTWVLHLSLQTLNGTQAREFRSVTDGTLYYSPLIHGAPN